MPAARVILALLILVAPAAHAQKILKYVTPDGRVIYSDSPVPGARLDDVLAPPPPPDPEAAAARRDETQRAQDATAARSRALDQVDEEIRAATQALNQAKAVQVANKDPRDNDYAGTVGPYRRLTDAYWERQKNYQLAVEAAQARLDAAVAARNRIRD